MKNHKRGLRRKIAHHKFERRLKIWIKPGDWHNDWCNIGGSELDKARDEIRNGSGWFFLNHTSTPCSCLGMCAYYKYERVQKQYRFKDEEW